MSTLRALQSFYCLLGPFWVCLLNLNLNLSLPEVFPTRTPQKKSLSDTIQELILGEPDITRKEIAGRLGISEYTVKEYLAKLRSEGRLERQGSDRSGVWVVKESGCSRE